MGYADDLQRSPDVVDHNGDLLPPHRKWTLSGGLRAYETSDGLVLEGAVASDVIKDAVRVATTGNVVLDPAPATIDGVTMEDGDRVLLKEQTSGAENGIYVWTEDGLGNEELVRATDFDESAKAKSGTIIYVREGTENKRRLYVLDTAPPITLGTTVLSFVEPSANPDFGSRDIITTGGLRYGGALSGPIVDTREGQTTLSSAAANTVLSWDPTFTLGNDGQLTVVAAIHARQASTDEFAWVELKLRVAIVGGTVVAATTAEVIANLLTGGATSDGWTFALEVNAGAIRVTARNPAWASSTDNVTVTSSVEYMGTAW